jgi:hypothetical protein
MWGTGACSNESVGPHFKKNEVELDAHFAAGRSFLVLLKTAHASRNMSLVLPCPTIRDRPHDCRAPSIAAETFGLYAFRINSARGRNTT